MKNNIILFLAGFLVFSIQSSAQELTAEMEEQIVFDSLFIEGVREFDKDYDKQDYQKAITALEEAVSLRPNNASAHYYLAYAYSGLNKQLSNNSAYRDISLTIKSSTQMEAVIELKPDFPPKLILSPYSKITSEWASLAMYYYINNDLDSAFWAFSQGRNRGGFTKFMLNIHRVQLDHCPANSILFSKGDDNIYNFLYLQVIENHRTDIAVVDLSLLNTTWYQQMLLQRNIVDFIPSNTMQKTFEYVNWNDTIIEVPMGNTERVFSWDFEAQGSNPFYITASDKAFMSIITRNQFRRPVLFTNGIPEEDYNNLWSEIRDEILSNRISPLDQKRLSTKDFNELAQQILSNIEGFNINSYDERVQLNNIRKSILNRVYLDWLSNVDADKENAKYLLNMLKKELPMDQYPYIDEETYSMVKDFGRVILNDTLGF